MCEGLNVSRFAPRTCCDIDDGVWEKDEVGMSSAMAERACVVGASGRVRRRERMERGLVVEVSEVVVVGWGEVYLDCWTGLRVI